MPRPAIWRALTISFRFFSIGSAGARQAAAAKTTAAPSAVARPRQAVSRSYPHGDILLGGLESRAPSRPPARLTPPVTRAMRTVWSSYCATPVVKPLTAAKIPPRELGRRFAAPLERELCEPFHPELLVGAIEGLRDPVRVEEERVASSRGRLRPRGERLREAYRPGRRRSEGDYGLPLSPEPEARLWPAFTYRRRPVAGSKTATKRVANFRVEENPTRCRFTRATRAGRSADRVGTSRWRHA